MKLEKVNFGLDAYDIILVAGQSNAEGMGRKTRDFVPHDNIKMIYQKRKGDKKTKRVIYTGEYVFQNAKYRKGKYSSFFHEFASLYESNRLELGRKILVVMAAVGGTGFSDKYWRVGDILCKNALQLTATALAANSQNKLVAMLWHQGESDAIAGTSQDTYYEYLKQLFATFRREFNLKEFPIIAGDYVCRWKQTVPHSFKIAQATEQLCHDISNSGYVHTEGLRENGEQDIIHFSTEANKELARRYFESFCQLN